MKLGEGVRGVVVSVIVVGGGISLLVLWSSFWSWWQENVPWYVPVGILLSLFLYGLLRASYEIETKKKALEDKIETDEQRAALKEALANALREGKLLYSSKPSTGETEYWVRKVKGLLLEALPDSSEAELFVSDTGLLPLSTPGETPQQETVNARLRRLTDLIQRVDSLRIRPDFDVSEN